LLLFKIIFQRSSSSNTSEQTATSDRDPQSKLSTEDYTDDDEYSTSEEEEEEEQLDTGLEQEDNDENETSNDQSSTDEDETSSSSEDEHNDPIIPVDVLTDPALIQIRLLIKRVRELVGVVHQSSNLHEYIRLQKKEKQLPGDVSNEWEETKITSRFDCKTLFLMNKNTLRS
jgi:cobalamin biosynthesis protein CobT